MPPAVSMQRIDISCSDDERLAEACTLARNARCQLVVDRTGVGGCQLPSLLSRPIRHSRATIIGMDALPPKEDVRPFLNVGRLLTAGGTNVPAVCRG